MRKLFQTQCPATLGLILVCIITLYSSCNSGKVAAPDGYDFSKPVVRELGKSLNEISGLTYNEEDSSLLAISDSKRKIVEIQLRKQKLKDRAEKFYGQEDFEDLVKLEDTVYVLISNGTILAVPLGAKDSTGTKVYPFWSKAKNDFESMYHDAENNSLVILCKSCEHEEGEKRTAYRFDLAGRKFDSTEFYTISTKEVKAAAKSDDANFKPSAAAIHPIEKRLYILASAGQLLVITDTRGKVLEVFKLNPDKHPQPEGLTFSPRGTMYISNEGKYGTPTLQVFPYSRKSATGKKNK